MTDIVVVESPAKAKTINRYLGSGYKVIASYGHIRDLPSKDGSVKPDQDFAMEWEIDGKSKKHVREIAEAVKGAGHLYLATDPDREGEAISWHVKQVLEDQNALEGVEVKRVVFNEITKNAILDAFKNPRELDHELVDAYLARRALDYLVGFTLSPVLWRKLPGSRSAGRVQSVALRLICERETEIENFKSEEYWSVKAQLKNGGAPFWANLTHIDGTKLDRMSLRTQTEAEAAKRAIEGASLAVSGIERKRVRRHPYAPFRTSTLQQEAARKLGFAAKRTMQVAQKLYEDGLITYMRTDGITMAAEAVTACRTHISSAFGKDYLPDAPRVYESKTKNAQEAHEAIRPTEVGRTPDSVHGGDPDHAKLYELIWKRTLASQMESAVFDQVAVDIRPVGARPDDNTLTLRATGSIIAFDGFLKLYIEGQDDDAEDEDSRVLPDMAEGAALDRLDVLPEQHFTQPPPRYSEASLVKKLEELGIGRPSTYASILSVLQDRHYVRLDKRRFIPEDRGRLVTAFLQGFFQKYVEYDFTADLEEQLDDVSGGRVDWKQLLRDFWAHFSEQVAATKELRVRDVLDNLNETLGSHFFRDNGSGGDPRKCRVCASGMLSLKLGRYGAFIGCSNYPDCKFTRPLAVANGDDGVQPTDTGPQALGTDPATGLAVTLRRGPYGPYVQLGEAEGKQKPKRASLARGMDAASVDLQTALGLLSLPRDVGLHPESGEMIQAGLGRFGPYIKHEGTYVSLKEDDVLAIGLNRAVSLLADAPKKARAKEIGKHPGDGKPITVRQGRYGYYVQHGAVRATLPKGTDKDELTLEGAVELIRAKAPPPKEKKSRKKKAAEETPLEASDAGVAETPAPKKAKSAPRKKKAAPTPVE